MKIPSIRKLTILGGLAVVFGVIGLTIATLGLSAPTVAEDSAPKLAELPVAAPVKEVISGRPVRITVPSVSIDLIVVDGHYNKDGTWSLSHTLAQFATPSQLANNTTGTTFIYGHDTKRVFHPLHNLKTGDTAIVTTDNGYQFTYSFSDSVVTDPYSVHEVNAPSETPRLSLLTCYGPTSADRRIFHLYLQDVQKVL